MPKVKTTPIYSHDYLGGWEFEDIQEGHTIVELDKGLIDEYNKAMDKYLAVCQKIKDKLHELGVLHEAS